ncbi:MAG: heavy metal-binding domain-containing protein [Candidatus Omnitrophota bacterium]
MKLLFILIIGGLVVFSPQYKSFACGGCIPKAQAQEANGVTKDTEVESKVSIKEVYQCPNCGYEQDKPGICPTCKTELKKVKVAHTYSCSTCDYSQNKPGKCPMCKSDLIEKDVRYECPMCKISDIKPGKCPKCGTELEEKIEPVKKLKLH